MCAMVKSYNYHEPKREIVVCSPTERVFKRGPHIVGKRMEKNCYFVGDHGE